MTRVPPGDAPPRETPSSVGTVIVTLIVLLTTGAVAYFAFFGAAAQQSDKITVTASPPPVPVPVPHTPETLLHRPQQSPKAADQPRLPGPSGAPETTAPVPPR